MPDLKSELMKLDNLTFDDDVTASPITPTKINVSREIWDTIKATPNISSIQLAGMVSNGDMTGISTRLKQMLDRGILSRSKSELGMYVYQVVGDSYPTFNRQDALAKAQAARQANKAKREKQRKYNAKYNAKKKADVVEVAALPIPSTSLTRNPSAEQLVNSMSVGMAKAVYLELKKVFEA
jgi:hypothetical protein